MQVPLEITYKNVEKPDTVETLIDQKLAGLEEVCDYITSCHIAIEKPHTHQHIGNPFRVRVDLRVPPGHEIVVKREPDEGAMHDTLDIVLRDAFDVARRQLKEIVQKQHNDVKRHPAQEVSALVEELERGEGYGFLRTVDGRRIFFHRNSVTNESFDRLETGTGVRFVEGMGDQGPQASTVEIVDRPGSRMSTGRTDS